MKHSYIEALKRFRRENKRLPNYKEMMEIFGLKSRSSVFYVVSKLIEQGIVSKDNTGKIIPASLDELPLIGVIRAGFAAAADEELKDTIDLDQFLVRKPEASYVLKVTGDSMIDAGIHENDLVVFERTGEYKPGDIVVAQTEDGYTLKYLRKKNNKMYLEAANDKYPDIHPREGSIVGVVVAQVRKYRG